MNLLPRNIVSCADGNRSDGVRYVVLTEKRQNEVQILAAMTDCERRSIEPKVLYLLDLERCNRLHTIRNDLPGKVARHRAHTGIVIVEIDHFRIVQPFEKLRFSLSDLVNRFEEFQMDRVHIGHDAFVGLRNRSEFPDLAFRRHSHFQHADVLVTLGSEQAQRKAELVVQVSDRSQNRELFP